MIELRNLLTQVNSMMKDGVHNLNLAIDNKPYDNKAIQNLIESCNSASTCDSARDIWN